MVPQSSFCRTTNRAQLHLSTSVAGVLVRPPVPSLAPPPASSLSTPLCSYLTFTDVSSWKTGLSSPGKSSKALSSGDEDLSRHSQKVMLDTSFKIITEVTLAPQRLRCLPTRLIPHLLQVV